MNCNCSIGIFLDANQNNMINMPAEQMILTKLCSVQNDVYTLFLCFDFRKKSTPFNNLVGAIAFMEV